MCLCQTLLIQLADSIIFTLSFVSKTCTIIVKKMYNAVKTVFFCCGSCYKILCTTNLTTNLEDWAIRVWYMHCTRIM